MYLKSQKLYTYQVIKTVVVASNSCWFQSHILFIYFNLFNVDVLLFYNNGYIAYQHANLSQPIHYKKINIKIYITDKNKNIKESQCKS